MMKKSVIVLLSGSLILAAVIGVFAFQSVRAAVPSQSGTTSFDHGIRNWDGDMGQYLADALGITLDELKAAYQSAFSAGLDQAVDQGLITQAQADELLSRGTAFPFGGRWNGWLSENGIDFEALLADALGISTEELQAAFGEAVSARIDQAVANGRLTEEQADLMKGEYALRTNETFQSAMQSAFESAVQQAIESGVITQAQADQILAKQSGKWGLRGMGEFGGRRGNHPEDRGGRGGFFLAPPESEPGVPSTTPSGSSGL